MIRDGERICVMSEMVSKGSLSKYSTCSNKICCHERKIVAKLFAKLLYLSFILEPVLTLFPKQ